MDNTFVSIAHDLLRVKLVDTISLADFLPVVRWGVGCSIEYSTVTENNVRLSRLFVEVAGHLDKLVFKGDRH
jgi:hypothetical protein